MIEQVLITTTADTSQAETQYVGLRQEISLLKKQLDTLEEGTKEYDATFTKLSAKMFEQRERMQMLKNSAGDLGQMLGNVSGLAGTVSQGFAGATAALSLFGIENENLLRTIQKVQAFESIARTLASLEDAPKKIKALMANIRGQFGGNNGKLSLEVNQGTTTTSTTKIDSASYKDAAESAKVLQSATAATAASAGLTAGNQSGVTGQLQVQIPLQEQLAALDETQIKGMLTKIGLEKVLLQAKLEGLTAEKAIIQARLDDNRGSAYDAARIEDLNDQIGGTQASVDKLTEKYDKAAEALLSLKTANEKVFSATGEVEAAVSGVTEATEASVEATNNVTQATVQATDATKKQVETTSKLGGVLKGIGGIAKGIGIGLLITGAIAGLTKLIELYKKQQERIKEAFQFRKELSDEVGKQLGKESATLEVLNFNYNKVKNSQKESTKYLKENEKAYASVGIEVDKIVSGEISYSEAIKESNRLLLQRAENMAYFTQLTKAYETKITAETIVGQYGEDILAGTVNYDDVSKDIMEQYSTIEKATKQIDFLRRQITELPKETKDGGVTATTALKTYTQLLGELDKLYEKIILNNPFTPEEYRKNEATFIKLKEDLQSVLLGLTTSNYSYGNIIEGIEDIQIKVLEAERSFNKNLRDLKIREAAWERDNLIREANEQIKIKKDQYKQILLDAKESLKEGAITQAEFDELSKNVSKAFGDPLTEFTAQLNKSLASGVIDFDTFKSELNKFAGTDLTVLDPSGIINLGNLTTDQYNYLQTLLGNWEDYYLKLQESNNAFKDSDKATTEAIFAARATTIEKSLSEVDRTIASANLKVIVAMNARNTQLWTAGFAGLRSGYQDVVDEITQLQNEIDSDANRRTLLSSRIELLNEELNSEMITAERRIELIDLIKQSEEELTQVKATETEKRLSIAAKEQEVRDAIFNGINEAITDIDSIIGASYNVAEQVELGRLNKLYEAKLITQEQYTKESEAISDKYTKKRLQLEIFTGTMSAIGSSIAAFQSAVESKIPYPYNLILAGISSAAAFGSVMASVAQLKSLSVGNTSVNPTSSNTGSSLNYSLNQQAATNERLMNSVTDSRVYVLESDITGTQATIKEIEEMSTF